MAEAAGPKLDALILLVAMGISMVLCVIVSLASGRILEAGLESDYEGLIFNAALLAQCVFGMLSLAGTGVSYGLLYRWRHGSITLEKSALGGAVSGGLAGLILELLAMVAIVWMVNVLFGLSELPADLVNAFVPVMLLFVLIGSGGGAVAGAGGGAITAALMKRARKPASPAE